ncbi:MAG: hypothetical protein Q9221_001800 [Calogaya cf. arnoldii]
MVLWSREAQFVAAIANFAALLQFSHAWWKIPSGGGYASCVWKPRERHRQSRRHASLAISKAKVQQRGSKRQDAILEGVTAAQQSKNMFARYVCAISAIVTLGYIVSEGMSDSHVVGGAASLEGNNDFTLGVTASRKLHDGYPLLSIAHLIYIFLVDIREGLTFLLATLIAVQNIVPLMPSWVRTLSGEPPLMKGRTRVRWTCSCGRKLYDDFQELRPGAAAETQRRLNFKKGGPRTQTTVEDSGRSQGNVQGGAVYVGGFLGSIWPRWKSRENEQGLPMHTAPQHRHARSVSPPPPDPENLYLLLCIPYAKHGTKCIHMDLCSLQSDQVFFRNLKIHYNELRGKWKSTFALKKLVSIQFVRFGMYKSELADIHKTDEIIPPESRKHEYRYNPIPAEIIPPIGPNHMMHLYHHPEDAEVEATCMDKIPKKLREKLRLCPNQGTRLGWGIYFVEGLNWLMIWILGSTGLVLSILFGVIWTLLKDDMQGGFGVAACMMMSFGFTVGILQTAFEGR